MKFFSKNTLLISASLALASCSKSPFLDPYAFAPTSSSKTWQPSSYTARKIADIDPADTLLVPSDEDYIALGDLFDIALNNSPETKRSWEEAKEMAAAYSSSMADYLPDLNFVANYTAIRQGTVFDGQLFMNQTQQWGPEFNLNYIIWDSGKRKYTTQTAFNILQQHNYSHNEEIQKVMSTTANAYYEFLYAKALLAAYEADLQNAEETYKAAQEKNLSGIFDETDMLQAKTLFLKKRVAVTTQTAAVKNTFVELLSVLGIPESVTFHLGTFPESSPIDPYDMTEVELIEVARKLRPELQATKAEILAAEAEVNKKKAELLPDIALSGQGGTQWFSNGENDNGDYTIQVLLSFPIFTGFYLQNQIKQAESELEKVVASYKDKELEVIKNVKQSNNDFEMAKQEINDTYEYLQAAQVEYNAMFERYKIGIVDILDLLNSEAYLSDARALYAKSQKNYYMSIINIAYSTGMLSSACPWTMEVSE